MITMENFATQAVKKLEDDRKEIPAFDETETNKKLRDSKLTQKQKQEVALEARISIVADKTCEALKDLCRQNEMFAKTIVEGGNLIDCIRSVMDGVNYEISDLDIYKKCAAYYFPDATVEMTITIKEVFSVEKTEDESNSNKILSFFL